MTFILITWNSSRHHCSVNSFSTVFSDFPDLQIKHHAGDRRGRRAEWHTVGRISRKSGSHPGARTVQGAHRAT